MDSERKKSTVTAMVKNMSSIFDAFDNSEEVILAFLDLKRAFDYGDHKKLLALKLFPSYLMDTYQKCWKTVETKYPCLINYRFFPKLAIPRAYRKGYP
ncbi:hypothetical protein HHI36_014048, partial [Cryptolaemus montrouzieri]